MFRLLPSAILVSFVVPVTALAAPLCEVFSDDVPNQVRSMLDYEFSVLDGIVDFGIDNFVAPGCEVSQYGFSGQLDTMTNTGIAVFEQLTGGMARFVYEASISRGTVSDAAPNAMGLLELSSSAPFDLRLDPAGGTGSGSFFPNGLTLSSTFGDAFFDDFTTDSQAFFEPEVEGGSDNRLTLLRAFNFVTVERNPQETPTPVPVPAAGLGLVSLLGMLVLGTRRRVGRSWLPGS